MPHAMLVKIRVKPGRSDDALRGLKEDVVPMVKKAPGFLRGTWFGDDQSGHGLVVFASEAEARQAASMVSAAPDDPVEIESATVYEVNAEA